MKAAVVRGNCDVAVLDVPEPMITKPSEIKIKVISGAICNVTDNKVYATDHPEDNWPNYSFPFIIGHECSGRVVEMGEAVSNLQLGERIVFWTVNGKAFADYLVIDTEESVVEAIDEAVPNDVAAIMEMAIGSARMLFTDAGEPLIKPTDAVVIIGLGPAGLIYHRIAKMMGAGKICGVGRRKLRLQKALEMGADFVVDTNKANYPEEVISLLGGKPDVIVDATGGDVVAEMIALAKPETEMIAYGVPPFRWSDRVDEFTKADRKPPQFPGREAACIAAKKCVEWAQSGEFGIEGAISHKLPIEEVGRGLDMCRLDRDNTLKVVISINEFKADSGGEEQSEKMATYDVFA